MALSEQEEFELLQLERERSLAHTAQSNQPSPLSTPASRANEQEGPGLLPVPLVVPENAPAQGLAGLGDLMSGKGLQQAAQTTQQADPDPTSVAGAIGKGVGQMVSPTSIAMAGLTPDIGALRADAKAGTLGQAGRVISGPGRAEAGQAIGAAEAAGGVHSDILPTLKDASANLGLKNASAKQYLNALMERLKSGEPMSAEALSQHHKMIADLLSKEPSGFGKLLNGSKIGAPAVAQAAKADSIIVQQLNDAVPGRTDAAANYAAAMMRNKLYKGAAGVVTGAAIGGNPLLAAFKRLTGG